VVADEIAVNYMLRAANGATKAATERRAVDFVALRGQAQAALKDLQDPKRFIRTADVAAPTFPTEARQQVVHH
jgi:4'-phosphopantetheinyl transferase EntD